MLFTPYFQNPSMVKKVGNIRGKVLSITFCIISGFAAFGQTQPWGQWNEQNQRGHGFWICKNPVFVLVSEDLENKCGRVFWPQWKRFMYIPNVGLKSIYENRIMKRLIFWEMEWANPQTKNATSSNLPVRLLQSMIVVTLDHVCTTQVSHS